MLPTHWSFAWTGALGEQVDWAGMASGALCSLAYTVVLLAAAWVRFGRKDITS